MNRTTKHTSPKRQRGVSLPVALILLVPLTLLSVTLANRNNLEELMAGSQRDGQQSLMNAESGLAMGLQALEKMVLDQVTAAESDATLALATASVDSLKLLPVYVPYDGTTLDNYGLANYGGRGSVTVVVLDNDDGDGDLTVDTDNQVILRSTGNYQSGERVVEAIVVLNYTLAASNSSNPPLTIFTEEYLKLNGNPDFYGPDSLVHSNSYIEFGGTTRIAGEIQQVSDNTVGTYQQAIDGVWGDFTSVEATTGATRVTTPYVYPPIYKGVATHYMAADCKIYDGVPGGTSLVTGQPTKYLAYGMDGYEGWTCDHDGDKNKKYEISGDQALTGFYYVEGNVIINGDPGLPDDPLKISIVAEGYLEVSGNPHITPYYPQGDFSTAPSVDALEQIILDGNPSYLGVNALDAVLKSDEVLLLAGGDLNIQGNPASSFNFHGIVAAHDQITISGNPRMSGAIIAENAKYTSNDFFFGNIDSGERKTDMLTMNEISGEPDIYGSSNLGGAGDPGTGEPIGANLKGWREAIE
jgi:Tfp pilus assembly protein PilX